MAGFIGDPGAGRRAQGSTAGRHGGFGEAEGRFRSACRPGRGTRPDLPRGAGGG